MLHLQRFRAMQNLRKWHLLLRRNLVSKSHRQSDPESAQYASVRESLAKEFKESTQSPPPTMSADLSPPQALTTRRVSSHNHLSVNWSSYLVRKYSRGGYTISGDTISGDIYIRIKHAKETLYVTIVEVKNLAATGKKGHCNPYVKLYLLPNLTTSKRKTRIENRSLNPFFNQTFEVF